MSTMGRNIAPGVLNFLTILNKLSHYTGGHTKMKVKETMKTVRKTFCRVVLAKNYALPRTNKKVAALRSIERKIKRYYKVNTEVIYISEADKATLMSDNINGYYIAKKDFAVVFVTDEYEANVRTLCHELTHAYQNYYMHDQYEKSTTDLFLKKVTYAKAWHEVHARKQAKEMCEYFLNEIRIAA